MHSTSFTHIAIVCVWVVGDCRGGGRSRGRQSWAAVAAALQLYSNIRHKLSLKMLSKKFSLFRKLLLPFWPTQWACLPPLPSPSHMVYSAATALLLITSIRSVLTHTLAHTHAHMSLKTIWPLAASSAICCGSSLLAAPFIGHSVGE